MEFTGERFVPPMQGEIKYEHLHRYALSLEFAANKSVLDVASGEGYGAALLARVARSVTGVDLDPPTIRHARHKYYFSNLNFLVGGCHDLPLPDASVDLVTSFETIEHHDLHEEMMLEIKRVLRPGGVLIISSPNRLIYSDERNYTNPFHVKELYYDELHELLGRHFKHLRLYGQRLATGSFIFQLQGPDEDALRAYSGDPDHLSRQMCRLSSPAYFVAVCSDAALTGQPTISSLYIDAQDDLLKYSEGEKLSLFEQLQQTKDAALERERSYEEQTSRQAEELATAREGYERQIERMARELAEARAGYEEQVNLQARELAESRAGFEEQVEIQARELAEARVRYEEQLDVQTEELSRARQHIAEYQGQIERLAGELAESRAGFEEQAEIQARELADVRAESEGLLAQRADELSSTYARLAELERQIADFRTQLEQQAAAYSEAQSQLTQRNAALGDVYSQLLRKDEVLNWIHTSRSWKVVTTLRRLYQRWSVSVNRLLRQLNLPARDTFRGAIESPAPGASCSQYIDVSGWVASGAGRVTLVEAFLDGFFLGAVRYSSERLDVTAAVPSRVGKVYGYAERLTLYNSLAGQRTLTIRAFDQHGHRHLFNRPITVTQVHESAQDVFAPPAAAPTVSAEGESHSPVEAESAAPVAAVRREETAGAYLLTQMEELIGKFENRMNRAPFILNWNTGLQLSEAFPHLAIISPCSLNGNGHLPYLDHTVDIVILPSRNGDELAEARRVAAAAVVQVEGLRSGGKDQLTGSKERSKLKLKAEWRDDEVLEAPPAETSIIIPVYNKVEYTRNCLAQLRNTLPPNFRGEIIVIDDASTDETPTVMEEFAARDARIRLLRNEQNMGFIRSCNRAAEAASGEVIIFLNNDTLPQPGWLPPLLKVLQDYPEAGAVGGKLIYSDGTLQEAGGVIFSDASGCNFGKHDKSAGAPLYNFLREVDYCSGALLATRRELFHRLGGFDTRYAPAYYEDTDYCFGLRERGYRVYYQPESVIIHFEGVTSGTDVTGGVKQYQEVNRTKFQAKWKHFLRHHPAPPRQYDFVTLHELSVRSWPRVNHEN